jgi:hypothetical protein
MGRKQEVCPKTLEELLNEKIPVKLTSGRIQRMSREKANILRHAVAAAGGNFSSLSLLLKLAESSEAGQAVIVSHRYETGSKKK